MHKRVLVVLLLLAPWTRPILAGVDSWTRVGPDEGNVLVLAAAPSNPSTVYAGLGIGGIFRSLDGGATWSFAGAGLNLHDTVRSLAVDARRPDTLWAATFQGIYRSVNGGTSWDRVRSDGVAALAQDPVSGVLYAGIQSGPMLRSRDGGASWQTLDRSPLNAFHLVIDPFHRQTLYAGTLSGLFKSTNGGEKWFRLARGLSADPITGLTLDPRSGTLYAATSNVIPGKIVFRSDDGGARWTPVDDGAALGYTTALAVQPGRRGTVWAVSTGRPFRSLDRGRTWSPVEAGLPGSAAVFTLLPGASTVLAGAASGPFRIEDRGTSWELSSQGMRAASISGLALDRLRPNRLWASTYSSIYRTATGGGTWSLPNGAPTGVNGPLAANPDRPGSAYLGLLGGVAHTGDAGSYWIPGAPLSCFLPETIAVDPLDSSVIYTSGTFSDTGCGLVPDACAMFRSDDAGQNWTCIRNGLPGADFLAPDPLQASRVYALVEAGLAGQYVYGSADRGASWSLLATGVKLRFLVPDPHRPGTLWGSGGTDGLLRSDDGGQTWTSSGQGIPQFTTLTTLALDPVDPDVLYAGTLQRGVFGSTDGGVTWAPLGTGLEGLNARFLVIDPRSPNTLYAGTDESGVMKLRKSGL